MGSVIACPEPVEGASWQSGNRAIALALIWIASLLVPACNRTPPPKQYHLEGQILAVAEDRQMLTIKHGDIEGLMPGMTMSFPVAKPELMNGRKAGETIKATLEVDDSIGRIVEITHVGEAPLPTNTNEAMLLTGLLDVGAEVPDAALIDQTDKRRSFAEWRGGLTLVTFIYTSCPLPTFCPLMDQNFSTIQRAMAEDAALAGKVKLVSVSFDPEHDTPAVLAAHAAKRKADPAVWTFLTGDKVTVERFAGRFGVGVIRTDRPNTEITHNLRTTLIGPDGRILKLYPGSDWTPGTVLADLRAAVRHP